jgi:hypothetical protein
MQSSGASTYAFVMGFGTVSTQVCCHSVCLAERASKLNPLSCFLMQLYTPQVGSSWDLTNGVYLRLVRQAGVGTTCYAKNSAAQVVKIGHAYLSCGNIIMSLRTQDWSTVSTYINVADVNLAPAGFDEV